MFLMMCHYNNLICFWAHPCSCSLHFYVLIMIIFHSVHSEWKRSMGHPAWTGNMEMYSNMDRNKQHGQCSIGHASWARTWSMSIDGPNDMRMDKDRQRGHGPAPWTWACTLDMAWTCSMDTAMQNRHEHGDATWMQHGPRPAPRT